MKILNLLLLVLFVVGCKTPEARRPVSQSSGSYIDESVERNKEMIAKEEDYIKKVMERIQIPNILPQPMVSGITTMKSQPTA